MIIRESLKKSDYAAIQNNENIKLQATLKTFTVRFAITIVFSLLLALLLQFAESPHPDDEFKTYVDMKKAEQIEIDKTWRKFTKKYDLNISAKQFKFIFNECNILELQLNDMRQSRERWSYRKSLYFTVTVITTIGYGDITPKTIPGMCLTMLSGIIGIPIMMLTLKTFGELINEVLQKLIKLVERIFARNDQSVKHVEAKILAINFLTMLILIICGAKLEQSHHQWTLFQGVYAWFVTMSTIGFGDFVVSKYNLQGNDDGADSVSLSTSIATFMFLMFGLGVVASLVNSLSDFFGSSRNVKNILQACFGFRESSKNFAARNKKYQTEKLEKIVENAAESFSSELETVVEIDGKT